jgi:hypothetical protein
MRAGDEPGGPENLRGYHPNERFADAQWKQAMLGRVGQSAVRQRTRVARHLEPVEWNVKPSGERPHIVVFGNQARRDQHAVCSYAERGCALLGGGKRAWREPSAQTVEFRAAGSCAALWKRDSARLGHIGTDRSAPSPIRRSFELDRTQLLPRPRLFVYKQAAGRALNTTDDFQV